MVGEDELNENAYTPEQQSALDDVGAEVTRICEENARLRAIVDKATRFDSPPFVAFLTLNRTWVVDASGTMARFATQAEALAAIGLPVKP